MNTRPQDPDHLLQSVECQSVPLGAGVVIHMPHLGSRLTPCLRVIYKVHLDSVSEEVSLLGPPVDGLRRPPRTRHPLEERRVSGPVIPDSGQELLELQGMILIGIVMRMKSSGWSIVTT